MMPNPAPMMNGKPSRPTIAEQEEEQDAADDRADGLDAEPVRDAQVAGVAGQRQALLGPLGEGARRDPRHAARQADRQRTQRPLHERRLELELLEVLGLHRPELGQARLDGIDRRTPREAEDDEEDRSGRECGDDDGQDLHGQTSMSTILRMSMKPMNIMNPPKIRITTPAGRPSTAGGLANIGSMNPGAAMNRKPASAIGRKPTT